MKKLFLLLSNIVILFLVNNMDAQVFGSSHSLFWEGTDIEGVSKAKFVKFNSTETIKYYQKKNESFVLKYSVDIEKGTFEIEIKSLKKGKIYQKKITNSYSDKIEFNSSKSDKLIITLKGISTTGKFSLRYGKKDEIN